MGKAPWVIKLISLFVPSPPLYSAIARRTWVFGIADSGTFKLPNVFKNISHPRESRAVRCMMWCSDTFYQIVQVCTPDRLIVNNNFPCSVQDITFFARVIASNIYSAFFMLLLGMCFKTSSNIGSFFELSSSSIPFVTSRLEPAVSLLSLPGNDKVKTPFSRSPVSP